jgi:hypothetical protein
MGFASASRRQSWMHIILFHVDNGNGRLTVEMAGGAGGARINLHKQNYGKNTFDLHETTCSLQVHNEFGKNRQCRWVEAL